MKTFISYSWSNPSHEQWVLDFATELVNSGVDVILDKWDLKEGHDSISFMEKMVTDPEIKKVIIISDKKYSEKAILRDGGVGTETQIISKEIYDGLSQDKFVAAVTEKDEKGKPFLPTYYKSRIYIDLSESEKYAENFEKLLRWIFNKPLYKKPALGQKPAFLDEERNIELGTSYLHKRLISAIKENKSNLDGALIEYLTLFSENLTIFRITKPENQIFDDLIYDTIEAFKPYKNEFLKVLFNLGQYGINENNTAAIHRFFESVVHYLDKDEKSPSRFTDWDFDVHKFIIQELFLNTIAVLIKFEKFYSVSFLLNQKYYVPLNSYGGMKLIPFHVFRNHLKSFAFRNDRLNLHRHSITGDLLLERSENSGLDFNYIMQADFICFLHSNLHEDEYSHGWWPDSLVYIGRSYNALEIFARSQSKKYFDKIKNILNINSVEELNVLLKEFDNGNKHLPRWDFNSFDPRVLIGIDKLEKER